MQGEKTRVPRSSGSMLLHLGGFLRMLLQHSAVPRSCRLCFFCRDSHDQADLLATSHPGYHCNSPVWKVQKFNGKPSRKKSSQYDLLHPDPSAFPSTSGTPNRSACSLSKVSHCGWDARETLCGLVGAASPICVILRSTSISFCFIYFKQYFEHLRTVLKYLE